jgi:two-component system response regulator PilR (NtrC family)
MAHSILFVDDDPDLRDIVTEQLVAAGYAVDVAGDGESAMKILESRKYDVVLLDITLPNRSGMDVLKHVKERLPSCKVIMLTGMIGLTIAIDSMRLGASDYITKPYNMDYLLASIRRAIERRP